MEGRGEEQKRARRRKRTRRSCHGGCSPATAGTISQWPLSWSVRAHPLLSEQQQEQQKKQEQQKDQVVAC